MKKIFLLLILTLSFCCLNAPAQSQSSYHIAIVKSRAIEPYGKAEQGIQEQFRESGIEARYDFYNVGGDISKGDEIVQEIRANKTDLIFTIGTEAFQAISRQIKDIPVVTAMLVDPEGEGIVTKDQANVFGAYLKVPFVEQFKLIKKIAPELSPVGIICWCKSGQKPVSEEAMPAAEKAGVDLSVVKIDSIKRLEESLDDLSSRSKALLLTFDNDLYNSATTKELLMFSARNKYPLIAFSPNYVKSGAMLSLSSDFSENGKSAARLAASLLKGDEPKEHFIPTGKVHVAWHKNVASAYGIHLSSAGQKEVDEYV